MPNHVQTKVIVKGDVKEAKRFAEEILKPKEYDEIEFDFDNITPMPKELENIFSGFCEIDGEKVEIWKQEDGKSIKITEKERKKLIDKYGADNPIEWCYENWGTKWNARDVCNHISPIINITDEDEELLEFSFWTAWQFAQPIFKKLANMYPNIQFHISCFDEGYNFAGRGIISKDLNTFEICEATDEIYEEVFDCLPPEYE